MAKKIGMMAMIVILAAVYFTTDSNAAAAWYACKVEMAGPGWGTIYLQLTDKSASFTKKWFIPAANSSNEMLATALTALSNGLMVTVYTDTNQSGYPQILALYLTQ
jgi:hypothetical protein